MLDTPGHMVNSQVGTTIAASSPQRTVIVDEGLKEQEEDI